MSYRASRSFGRIGGCVVAAGLLAGLSACGGGGGGDTTPQFSALSVDRLSYGRLSTFTLTGSNLSSGVTLTASGCSGLATVAASSNAMQQVVTCTPTSEMAVTVTAKADGVTPLAYNATVPKPRVTFATTLGTVVVELEPAKVAATVDNFLSYVNSGFYNGTLFHRVVKDFVVQGGGFTAVAGSSLTPQTGLRSPIALETNKGLSNVRGSLAMARTSIPDSATSQFYINTVDNSRALDYASAAAPGYAVFGSVVSGMAVVDTLNGVATQAVGSNANVPVSAVLVTSATQTK